MATQVTLDSAKFERLFTSIERQMIMQSSFLESIYNIQTYQLDLDKEREETRRRELDLLRMKPTAETTPQQLDTGEAAAEGATGDKSKLTQFLAKLFTFGVAGLELFNFKNLIGAGLAVALAGPIEGFLSGVISRILENLGADVDFADGVGSALGRAAAWGNIGRIFGSKIGLIFAAAGAGSAIGERIFASLDKDKDGIIEAFGAELDAADFSTIGGAAGAAAIPLLQLALSNPFTGVIAVIGAAVAAGGFAINAWMEEKRIAFYAEIDGKLNEKLNNIKNEESVGYFKSLGMDLGISDPENTAEWLQAYTSDVADLNEKGYGMSGIMGSEEATGGMKGVNRTIDWKAAKESTDGWLTGLSQETWDRLDAQNKNFATQLTKSMENPGFLMGMEPEDIKQLMTITGLLGEYYGLDDENKKLAEAYDKLTAAQNTPEYQRYEVNTGLRSIWDPADVNRDRQDFRAPLVDPSLNAMVVTPDASQMTSAAEKRILAEAARIKPPTDVVGTGVGSTVVAGNNSGNVNRGGDVINNNTTNIFGNPASKSLDEGNSVPRLQYGVQ